MKSYSQIGFYLWCAQPLLEGAVAVVLWCRKLNKLFPVFFTYILAQIVIFAITFPLRSAENYEWYFYAYWLSAAVNALLSFRIIHEIFLDVFRPYHMLKDLGTVLFKWTGLVMLLVSVIVAFSNSAHGDPLSQAVTLLQRSVRMVQCGLILFLLLFSQFLGVSRKQQSFGIAFGFGLIASVELILLTLYSGGYLPGAVMNLANTLMADVAIVIWMSYALARSSAREVAPNHLKTQRWERSLADLQTASAPEPAPSGSLIPMFEGMVERAFSRDSNLDDLPERAAAARAGAEAGR
ncbi:MAG TPA: hypothetical protein VNW47_14525 [Terriglobales bacterium]|jgi:hypothetical protein|nr:hypothetical protein [Terriglobales bacterium]